MYILVNIEKKNVSITFVKYKLFLLVSKSTIKRSSYKHKNLHFS